MSNDEMVFTPGPTKDVAPKILIVHSNANYFVRIAEDRSGYELVNSNNGVVEKADPSLPSVITEAEYSNAYLVHEVWKWTEAQVEQQVKQAESWFASDQEADVTFDFEEAVEGKPDDDPVIN